MTGQQLLERLQRMSPDELAKTAVFAYPSHSIHNDYHTAEVRRIEVCDVADDRDGTLIDEDNRRHYENESGDLESLELLVIHM